MVNKGVKTFSVYGLLTLGTWIPQGSPKFVFVGIDELGRCRAAGHHSSKDAAPSRDAQY